MPQTGRPARRLTFRLLGASRVENVTDVEGTEAGCHTLPDPTQTDDT